MIRSVLLFTLISATVWANLAMAPEQAKGFYSEGTLVNADSLENEAPGLVKLFRTRERRYGSVELIEVLKTTAAQLYVAFPEGERLQVGDISAEHGGLITKHASHQNGLDADLVYFRKNKLEQDLANEEGFAEVFVEKSRLSANFDIKRNWEYMKLLAKTGKVQRVFVDPVIKKAFCSFAKKSKEKKSETQTLRMMRAIEGHADHFHIRLACPQTSPACVAQEAPPVGDGCNEIFTSLPSKKLQGELPSI